jgi:hypothetical protein
VGRDEELEMIRDALNFEERIMKDLRGKFFDTLAKEPIDEVKRNKLRENLVLLAYETLEHEKALNDIYIGLLSGIRRK